MRFMRRAAGLAAGAGLLAGAAVGTAAPAHAFGSELTWSAYTYDTDDCPCTLIDPIDNTYFQYDAGGKAVKVSFRVSGSYTGKMEFHPSGEKIWLYDSKADGDTYYLRFSYTVPGGGDTVTSSVYSPRGGVGPTVDLDIPEGWPVTVTVYDDAAGTDRIGSWTGIG
ncbi:hypothetical protein AB0M28_32525 [Streptomyces sp. NPDC051940]|uniref:hypothetical protein n=1 Tax=Streptomyces sp. NPDC051940 TaxID=3155675 RepID=UPI0034237E05